jgi:putative membrane protein
MHDYCGWGFGFGGGFFTVILFVLAIVGIISLIRGCRGRGMHPRGVCGVGGDTPLDALKLRYARGEISQEEFERMRKELEK